jgi:hypothetical protein
MHELIQYLNEMKAKGLIGEYAIGGATALIYYFEPIQTQDVDVFVVLTGEQGVLVNLSPIYSFLAERGCDARNEYLIIKGIPVQFLVPYNPLVEEAVTQSRTVLFGSVECRLPTLEHLMAIMVQTGRMKDKARLEELGNFPDLYNKENFSDIIKRFGLETKWQAIKNQINFP